MKNNSNLTGKTSKSKSAGQSTRTILLKHLSRLNTQLQYWSFNKYKLPDINILKRKTCINAKKLHLNYILSHA
jgi:hypothetical protein